MRSRRVLPAAQQATIRAWLRPGEELHSSFGPTRLQQLSRQLRKLWHARAKALLRLGWDIPGLSRQAVFSCPAVWSSTARWACHQYHICPFCWARRVVVPCYRDLAYVLYGDVGGRGRRDLVVRKCITGHLLLIQKEELIPADVDPLATTLQRLISAQRQSLSTLKFLGSLSLITVEPAVDGWHTRRRVLAVVPEKYRLPTALGPLTTEFRGELPPVELAQIVGRMCAYPHGLLEGDAAQVLEVLMARRGDGERSLRVLARRGCFRWGNVRKCLREAGHRPQFDLS